MKELKKQQTHSTTTTWQSHCGGLPRSKAAWGLLPQFAPNSPVALATAHAETALS